MRVLDMVHQSFENPAAIVNRTNVASQSTTLLLQQLSALPHSFSVAQRVVDTTDFVSSQIAQALAAK
ncbi:MAG: hypothetical protein JO307_19685 [Bryobacterales bacterium]|nr:hypothetical protein [Bryobacterales bacterium]MBV9401459.1 hypothetical protein [Bryobacterales bacterium]